MKVEDLINGAVYVSLSKGDKPRLCQYYAGGAFLIPVRAIDDIGGGCGSQVKATPENCEDLTEKYRTAGFQKPTQP